jgi:hypothetical protein
VLQTPFYTPFFIVLSTSVPASYLFLLWLRYMHPCGLVVIHVDYNWVHASLFAGELVMHDGIMLCAIVRARGRRHDHVQGIGQDKLYTYRTRCCMCSQYVGSARLPDIVAVIIAA